MSAGAASGWNVVLVGATGLVGESLLKVMSERRTPVGSLRLFASRRSAGRMVRAFDRDVVVKSLDDDADPFLDADAVFFAGSDDASKLYAKSAAAAHALVIDKSSTFRLDPAVPLVVPEVNAQLIPQTGLVANPNCTTIPLAVALAPIDRAFGLAWVSVSTYQSVSGAGREAADEMADQLRGGGASGVLPRRIAGNVFPEVGDLGEDFDSGEERKIESELRKILDRPRLAVSATTVRVPVAVGHCEAVAFGTVRPATRAQLGEILRSAPGVKFQDGIGYATPIDAAGTDDVFVGRLRPDRAHPGAYLCWIACDNLRKGAATNALQIAELALAKAAAPA